MNDIEGLSVHPLEGPRVLFEKLLRRLFDRLIWDQNIGVDLLLCDGVKVAIDMKVPLDLVLFIGVSAFGRDWLHHEVVRQSAVQVRWHDQDLLLLFQFPYLKVLLNLTEHLFVNLFLLVVNWCHEVTFGFLVDERGIRGFLVDPQGRPQLLDHRLALDNLEILLLEPSNFLGSKYLNVYLFLEASTEGVLRIGLGHGTTEVQGLLEGPYS